VIEGETSASSDVLRKPVRLLESGPMSGRDQADSGRARALLESSGQQTITPAMLRKFAMTARERIRIERPASDRP